MQNKRNACSDAASSKQAETMENTSTLFCDSTTFNGPISSLLSQGADNGKTSREISTLTGYSRREIETLVESERRDGIPIISDCVHGYFLPSNMAEVDAFVTQMEGRAKEIKKTASAVKKAMQEG